MHIMTIYGHIITDYAITSARKPLEPSVKRHIYCVIMFT